MPLQIGIVGLPNVGKSTLFNGLTSSRSAEAANYPFCTIEPNVGIVEVPDPRLGELAKIVHPEKIIPAAIEFVDIAGLVKGASEGQGLGNAFLSHIREVDAICHVVRLFPAGNIIHVEGTIDGKRDREIIETELMLADLQTLKNRIDRVKQPAKIGDKEKAIELSACEKMASNLEAGKPAMSTELTKEEIIAARTLHLLTRKPLIVAANVAEEQLKTLTADAIRTGLDLPSTIPVVRICAKVEEELQDLSAEEAHEYLVSLGVQSTGLDALIHAAYDVLGYRTYFTAGPKEVRAWNIIKGWTAPQAAGVIHTDFEKGFIRAEVIAYSDYIAFGGEAGARDHGKLRLEGKEYVMQDGDVCHFRFNV